MEDNSKNEENKIRIGKQEPKKQQVPNEFLDEEFLTPTDNIELPSLGVFNNGQKTVEIKYLTAEEDDVLFSPELLKSGKVLDALLQVSIIDKTLKADDMLIGDRNAVLIHLRRTGLGDEYNPGPIGCPSCKEDYEPDIDLSKLSLKKLEHEPDSNGWYEFFLPTIKKNIKFRFLRGSDENKLSKSTKGGVRRKGSSYKISTSVTDRYKMQIMEVEGNKDKTYISRLVSAMPMLDSVHFRKYVREIAPGVDFSYNFCCKNCGYTYEDDVPLNYRLFYPNADI